MFGGSEAIHLILWRAKAEGESGKGSAALLVGYSGGRETRCRIRAMR